MPLHHSSRALSKGLSFVLVFSLLALAGCDQSPSVEPPEQQEAPEATAERSESPGLEKALKAQKKRGNDFLDRPGIVGVGSGLDADGNANLVVYGTTPKMVEKANLPSHANGVPVRAEITGLIVADADETSRQRPAPVGFSIGHPDITAGTYGARVKDGSGNVYALSNNHILADNNNASIGDNILQPGPTDGGTNPEDKVGELADYEPIDYEGTNTIDAAIASTSSSNLDFATSSEGYGTPGTSPVSASVGDNVQKYGRTTGLTKGEVSEINVTVDVCFETNGPFSCAKSATFENQIGITPGDFSDGGDSGSLIVTDNSDANPVGLLFAGSDTRTLANPIGDVLSRFNVSIDDGSDGGNSPPTASFTTNCTDLDCTFDGSGSSDTDGSIASYEWDFGDGTTATGEAPSHTYGSDGTYTVTLTVTDDAGATDSQSQDVTVSSSTNSPPTASFTSSCTDLTCDFDGSGSSDSDGSIASYDWDFGDGTTATGEAPSHTYGSDGTYTVTLTVTDDAGATDSQSQDVSVSSSATFAVDSITPTSVAAGSSVDVTITGSGFEGGATVALENGNGPTPSVSNTTVVDGTEITATISTKSGGPKRDRLWDVRVTNPDGTSDVLVDGFTVTP